MLLDVLHIHSVCNAFCLVHILHKVVQVVILAYQSFIALEMCGIYLVEAN